jgi:hypothetical protein
MALVDTSTKLRTLSTSLHNAEDYYRNLFLIEIYCQHDFFKKERKKRSLTSSDPIKIFRELKVNEDVGVF